MMGRELMSVDMDVGDTSCNIDAEQNKDGEIKVKITGDKECEQLLRDAVKEADSSGWF